MITTSNFKSGISIIIAHKIFQIIEYQHVKPGKGGAFVRTKMRDLSNDSVIDRTFRSGEKFEQAFIKQHKVQYLYNTHDTYFFMDSDTFEQISMEKSALGSAVNFLKDGVNATALYHKDKLLEICLPPSIDLKVTHTEPGVRGDTARAGYKPATLETGVSAQVPLFIKQDEIVNIDTRTGKYLGRA